MRGLLKLVVGLGLPIVALMLVMQWIERPVPDAPGPPQLAEAHDSPNDPPPDGRWEVAAADSFVGYRIGERNVRRRLDGDAVGRTDAVEGFAEVSDGVVEQAEVRADLRQLTSDEQRRDRAIKTRYLESNEHPEARFTLTEPFAVASGVPDGRVITHQVAGLLEIRGVEQEVEAELRVRWDGDDVAVVGAVPIELADFDISPPSIYLFREVEDHGEIELDLRLRPTS